MKHHRISLKRRAVTVGLLAALALPVVGGVAFAGGKPSDNFFACKHGLRMGHHFSPPECNDFKYRGNSG